MTATSETIRLRSKDAQLRLLVAREFEERACAAGLSEAAGFDRMMRSAERIPGGRTANRLLDAQHPSIRLRPFEHGGLLAPVLGDRYLGANRAVREFDLWRALRTRGAPLPEPVLAVSRRRGAFWHAAIGTLDREDALDGRAWLERGPSETEVQRACAAFARALRRFHDAGGLHGDLHLRNVLVEVSPDDPAAFECLLIDLDRSRMLRTPSPGQRLRDLMRFARSIEKSGRSDLLSTRLRALLISAYCGEDRILRRALLRGSRRESLRLVAHRLAWRLGPPERPISRMRRR